MMGSVHIRLILEAFIQWLLHLLLTKNLIAHVIESMNPQIWKSS